MQGPALLDARRSVSCAEPNAFLSSGWTYLPKAEEAFGVLTPGWIDGVCQTVKLVSSWHWGVSPPESNLDNNSYTFQYRADLDLDDEWICRRTLPRDDMSSRLTLPNARKDEEEIGLTRRARDRDGGRSVPWIRAAPDVGSDVGSWGLRVSREIGFLFAFPATVAAPQGRAPSAGLAPGLDAPRVARAAELAFLGVRLTAAVACSHDGRLRRGARFVLGFGLDGSSRRLLVVELGRWRRSARGASGYQSEEDRAAPGGGSKRTVMGCNGEDGH